MGRIVCLAALVAALLAPAAQAAGPEATIRALDKQMRQAGSSSGAYVIDLDSGQELYARAPDVPRIPASVNKLYTTSAALQRYGAEGQLDDRGPGRHSRRRVRRGGRQPLPARPRRPELQRGGGPRPGPRAGRQRPQARRRPRDRRRVRTSTRCAVARTRATGRRTGSARSAGSPSTMAARWAATRASRRNPAYYAADRFRIELRRAGVKVKRASARRGHARGRGPARRVGVARACRSWCATRTGRRTTTWPRRCSRRSAPTTAAAGPRPQAPPWRAPTPRASAPTRRWSTAPA